jgi:hypothetical protein
MNSRCGSVTEGPVADWNLIWVWRAMPGAVPATRSPPLPTPDMLKSLYRHCGNALKVAEEAGAKRIELEPARPVVADFRVLGNAQQPVPLEAHGFGAVPFQEHFGAIAD